MRCGLSRFAHRTCSSLDLSDHLGRHLGVRSGTARFEEAGGCGFFRVGGCRRPPHAVVTVGSDPLACLRRQRPRSRPRSSSRAADIGVVPRADFRCRVCVVSVLSSGYGPRTSSCRRAPPRFDGGRGGRVERRLSFETVPRPPRAATRASIASSAAAVLAASSARVDPDALPAGRDSSPPDAFGRLLRADGHSSSYAKFLRRESDLTRNRKRL